MPSLVIPSLKFIGTISLGLLTGISYTNTTLTLPTLLLLPSAPLASTTLTTLRARTATHTRVLATLAITAYTTAFLLAPARGGRHPYLLWTSLAVALGAGVDVVAALMGKGVKDEADVEMGDVNGEVVREGVERGRVVEGWKGGVWGVAFLMGVVGIWGDGSSVVVRR